MTNPEKQCQIDMFEQCAQAQLAPAPINCPVCLSKIKTYASMVLADGHVWRYRVCPNGCYRKRAILCEVIDV